MVSSAQRAISQLRKEYSSRSLNEKDVGSNPFQLFDRWFKQAISAQLIEPNAMLLATASKRGQPSVRPVLLKDWGSEGFIFFTNYQSRKGLELEKNPRAAVVFFWAELEREVRIEGTVQKVSRTVSEKYFALRPRDSQIAAWASQQSSKIPSRKQLEGNFETLKIRWQGLAVPCPPHWGGFILRPQCFEFWQGRANRLHDRIAFQRAKTGRWKRTRLAP